MATREASGKQGDGGAELEDDRTAQASGVNVLQRCRATVDASLAHHFAALGRAVGQRPVRTIVLTVACTLLLMSCIVRAVDTHGEKIEPW